MSAAMIFSIHARADVDLMKRSQAIETARVNQPRITQDGQHTIMKLCARCAMQMPHIVRYPVCILCAMDEPPAQPPQNVEG